MNYIIENETEYQFDFDYEKVIKDVIEGAIDYIKCPYEAEVSVIIVSNDEIREINNEQRGIDKVTDVLSFPLLEYEKPGDFSFLENDESTSVYFNPESGELVLGDIVLNATRIEEQAAEYGHSVKRELAFLTAHSMMHLFGFDHMDEEEAKIMEAHQEKVLQLLGITRDVLQ